LVFRPIPFLIAVRQFLAALRGPITIDSNTDFVTNVLLAVPLGYFAIAALVTDRPGVIRRSAAAAIALLCCFVVSIGAEFAQLFFQGRTASVSDVVAQCGGAVMGVAFWALAGDRVTQWLRDLLAERARPALAERLLLAYCVLFAVSQVMPLDLTLSLGQLAQKYR
jgi:VanZ family protein